LRCVDQRRNARRIKVCRVQRRSGFRLHIACAFGHGVGNRTGTFGDSLGRTRRGVTHRFCGFFGGFGHSLGSSGSSGFCLGSSSGSGFGLGSGGGFGLCCGSSGGLFCGLCSSGGFLCSTLRRGIAELVIAKASKYDDRKANQDISVHRLSPIAGTFSGCSAHMDPSSPDLNPLRPDPGPNLPLSRPQTARFGLARPAIPVETTGTGD
jgi:hypothetical protein